MSRRKALEHQVALAKKRVETAPKDLPKDVLKAWKLELVDLELELNNMVDDEDDNNDD